MSEIKIEKNVPMPAPHAVGLTASLRKLDIGDSFVCPIDKRSSIMPTASRLGIRISIRKQADKTIRVWRTA